MNRSLILSNLRVEIRRTRTNYSTERTIVHWVRQFLEEMSISHSSQISEWQRELFLSRLRNKKGGSAEDLLQARSALLFLYEKVLKKSGGFSGSGEEREEAEPGVFRITA